MKQIFPVASSYLQFSSYYSSTSSLVHPNLPFFCDLGSVRLLEPNKGVHLWGATLNIWPENLIRMLAAPDSTHVSIWELAAGISDNTNFWSIKIAVFSRLGDRGNPVIIAPLEYRISITLVIVGSH